MQSKTDSWYPQALLRCAVRPLLCTSIGSFCRRVNIRYVIKFEHIVYTVIAFQCLPHKCPWFPFRWSRWLARCSWIITRWSQLICRYASVPSSAAARLSTASQVEMSHKVCSHLDVLIRLLHAMQWFASRRMPRWRTVWAQRIIDRQGQSELSRTRLEQKVLQLNSEIWIHFWFNSSEKSDILHKLQRAVMILVLKLHTIPYLFVWKLNEKVKLRYITFGLALARLHTILPILRMCQWFLKRENVYNNLNSRFKHVTWRVFRDVRKYLSPLIGCFKWTYVTIPDEVCQKSAAVKRCSSSAKSNPLLESFLKDRTDLHA